MLLFAAAGRAQTAGPRAVITQAIDESRLVRLAGNTRPEANAKNDRGPVRSDLHLDMYLQLKRSPEQDRAAEQFVESLTDKASLNFHKWITAAEYGERFGAASEDIATVSRWLESHGFTVNNVPANRMVIDFSGDAGQVREALHTEIHALEVAGKGYFANMSDPQIPATLLPAVTGVVSLHNFKPHSMLVPRAQYTVNPQVLPVVPGDLGTIYNLNPAFSGGFTGLGQTIVVVEDTDLYSGTGDWNVFRQTFGLNQYSSGSLTQVHPAAGAGGSCTDPGTNGDDAEAAIDAEWASAAAPNAAIVMASCSDTTNFGGFIALQNMLTNGGALPSIVSISYGEAETESGAALNSYINTLYQTAAAAGVSVFVSAGDAAAAAADRGGVAAIYGISVSGWASTIYNVAVGGTDFGDYASNTTTSFWNSTNGTDYNSAKSYIPEIPWNDSCASSVTANYYGYNTAYGGTGFCNAYPYYANTIGGSGGPSGCATGARSIDYAVSGTCAGYAKPSWQAISGNPSDGVRDLPDVALFASNGQWGHYYVVCLSDGASCAGPPSEWVGFGGTSVSAPIMAGIQALINQALGTANAGNPSPVYYQIGRNEYNTTAGETACNSTAGPAATCAFNDITQGDMVLPCAGAFNCYLDGMAVGVLSTSDASYQPAYAAAAGWDFATGIGSVNAFNLLKAYVNSIAPTSAPAAPVLVSPANGATAVLPEAALAWNASAEATSYDVYFGTATVPPLVANTTNLNYTPGAMSAGTTYHWAIGARNSLGANVSAAWYFTTSCVLALNPSGGSAPPAGGAGTIPVTATTGCGWTAVSNVSWITITSGASGSGNGTVGYTVAADTAALRHGTITIAGQTFTVTQAIYPLIGALAGGLVPPTAAPGTSVSIPVSYGIAADSSGNTYFSSPSLNAVFKADTTGVVTRIAGTGLVGYSGDNGPPLSAQLSGPQGVALDASGNLYIADSGNWRIRKVSVAGTITTVAGNGSCCADTGDGGPATSAEIGVPYGLAVDSSGNLYISDIDNNVIRKVATSGTITTVAGNGTYGYAGDGGAATSAEFRNPYGLAVDASGNLYIADGYNYRVRKVSTSGIITTVVGTGNCCGYTGDGGPATSAWLYVPSGVAVDAAGDLYIADTDDQRIRKVNLAGTISTVAGNGSAGYLGDGGPATSAELDNPVGVAVDAGGNLHIADSGEARIRLVSAAGTITTLVGGATGDGGLGVFGYLSQPAGIARDNSGNTYVTDTNNNRVRKVAANGIVTTVAGTGEPGLSGDGGPATSAQLNSPAGLALDKSGNLYIADSNNRVIRKVSSAGTITTVAGTGGCCGYTGDGGPATSAQIGTPYGLAVDSSGNLYISDITNDVIRKVATSGTITTVAGNGTYGYSGDGGAATSAEFRYPYGLAVDASGNLYIADRYNYRVREVSGGIVTTIAGNGSCCFSGDGGPATSASLDAPSGVAVDTAGDLYIADTYNNRIREVTGGTIETVAGDGTSGYSGDGGSATDATLQAPGSIAVDAAGIVAIADWNNNAARLLTPPDTQAVLGIQSAHSGAFTEGQTGATYALTVTNGPGAGTTAGTVTVTEIVPAGLTLTSMAGAGWTCTSPACTRSDALIGGASYPAIAVTVTVSAAAPSQVTNLASVSGGGAAAPGRAADFTIVTAASAGQEGQTITFGTLSSQTYGTPPFKVSASASSGLPVSFNSQTTSVCTVSSATVTLVSVGTCTIQATQAGNASYAAAPPVSQSFQVTQATQTITFGALSNQPYGTAPFTVSATVSSGLPVTFSSQTTPVCTVSNATVTLVSVGTCTIQAMQAGNTVYAAATPVSRSFQVTQASQTITFGALSNQPYGTAPFTVSATASSGLAVSFASTTPAVCTVSSATVTLVSAGTCTIQAMQAGNTDYTTATPVNESFQVTQASQTIVFGALANQSYGTAPFTVSATASSGLAVSFASTTPAVCTVSSATVTLVSVGTCTIQATQAGNTDYTAATPVNESFQVTQYSQTITFGALANQAYGTAPFTVSATASSGLAVSFASTTPAVCTVAGATVTLVSAGTCTIQATQAGNTNYAAATPVNRSFQVTQASQTITFGALASQPYGTAPFAVSATASSGLAVSFASTTPAVCTVSSATVTLVSVGACTIQATQAGNSNYTAAAPVNESFQVTQGSQTIAFGALANQAYGAPPFTVSATASSGLAVSFASTTPAVCTVLGATVTLVSVGTCTIQATQAGNTNYAAAAPVNQSFQVAQYSQTITFGALANQVYGAAPFTVGATASSGLAVSFASTTPAVCTMVGATVTLVSAGTCTIQATQAGNSNYAAATPVNQSFQVTQASQTIAFGPLGSQPYGTAPFTVSATASSGLAVSFASTTPAVCTVSVATVTLISVGTCTIQATQAGNINYAAATPVNQSFQVTQHGQTIAFGTLANQPYGTAPFTVSATASSGLAVSFASTTLAVCTVSNAAVTLVSVGTCTIQATQAGNTNYAAATPVNQSFQVTQASQTIAFGPLANQAYGTPPFAVSATASSGLAVSFASTTQTVCTMLSATVTLISTGVCTIQATQAGNADYAPAPPVSQSFQVVHAPALTIAKTHTGTPSQGQNGAAYTVTVGNSAFAMATSGTVTVTENLPAGLTLVSMSGNNWSCAGNTCSRGDTLGAGASYDAITVTVNVAPTAPTQVTNQVSVSGGGSPSASASDVTNIGGLQFYPLTPCRVADTRQGAGFTGTQGPPYLAGGTSRGFQVAGLCGVPANATAYSLNVTVVPRTGALGFLTTWPTGQMQPLASTLNSPLGQVVANAALVPAGTNGNISIYASNDTDVLFDINGYFAPPSASGLQFYPLTPCRVADTRTGAGFTGSQGPPYLSGGTSRNFQVAGLCGVPTTAAAYSLNVTVVPRTSALGYLTTWPTGQPQPWASTLNSPAGAVVANAALVPAGINGDIGIYASDATDVLFDINGYFAAAGTGGLDYYAMTPCRVADTRSWAGFPGQFGPPSMGGNTSRSFPVQSSVCNVPSVAAAYSFNVTVVPSAGVLNYLTTWPTGVTRPLASTLNSPDGMVVANAALVPAGTGGAISIYVSDPTDVLFDIGGYFAAGQ